MPLPSQVRVDRAMSDFSLRYGNPEYIAERAFPVMQGILWDSKDAGKYFVYDKANLRLENDGPLGTRTPAPEANYDVSTTDFTLGRYALKELVTQEEIDNADEPIDPEEDATAFLTDKLLIGREYRAASILFSSSYLTVGTTLSGTDQWSDTTSDPLGAIETAKASLWAEPNACIMGVQVWQKVRHHPDIVDRYKYTAGGGVTKEQFAALLGIDPSMVLIGSARRNTADEGQTAAVGFIWGKHCVLARIDPAPRPRTMTATATLQRKESRRVSEWANNDPEGTWKKVEDRYVHKVIAADLAYLFTNAVA